MINLKQYRRAAVPLLAVQTADPAEIIRLALKEVNGDEYPVLVWDCIHGIRAVNPNAEAIADALNNRQEPAIATGNPIEMLRALENLKDITDSKPIIVALGLTEIMDEPQSKIPVRQAIWNLRDSLSQIGAILIMTAPMGWINPFPDDIAVVISELPDRNNHIEKAKSICNAAGVKEPSKKSQERIGDALLGLSAFAAEQALALSVTKKGIDTEVLWERKRQQISETQGLSVYNGKERLDDLGGLDQGKKLLKAYLDGKYKAGAIVFIDEIEKYVGNASGDTSGVSQAINGYLLSYMQDMEASGIILVGPPGAAKSAMAKAIGNEAGIPTVTLDLGGIKGSLVGESEAGIRKALSVITAISGGRPFFVATCNSISVLPPELRRRFTVGTMYFDLPDKKEKPIIWDIYIKKYQLDEKQERPADEGWTGAEIKQCAKLADQLGVTLVEAAQYIVPVAIAAKEQIEKLRKEASGRYLSASNEGVYTYSKSTVNIPNRKIDIK